MKRALQIGFGLMALLNLLSLPSFMKQAGSAFTSPPNPTNVQLVTATTKSVAVSATPSATSATARLAVDSSTVAAKLVQVGLKPDYASLYLEVQQKTGTPWQLLAAVHAVETGQSGSTSRMSPAGAVGPMQFMPTTFSVYASDGNGDGAKDIYNVDDAMLTAGRYLASNGAAQHNYQNALYRYNHSNSYVSRVMSYASRLGI